MIIMFLFDIGVLSAFPGVGVVNLAGDFCDLSSKVAKIDSALLFEIE